MAMYADNVRGGGSSVAKVYASLLEGWMFDPRPRSESP